ncbi:MAG: glutamate 5-kinase [Candidatus Firestonebacteria bacterium]|nr:glutamate 5-kinase [Candidatus Firestonebacteria bacterium]
MQRRQQLKKARRIVVKIGTSLLTSGREGVKQTFLTKVAAEVATLRQAGREVIIVTSGAIGLGVAALGAKEKPKTIPGKQAMAAVGQPRLMQAYAQAFAKHRLTTGQILLTADDIQDRERYAHARNALLELLRLGVVPVFNENDTVGVQEIKIGENDTLSAHVTHLAEADLLIILTDVAGLYTANPVQNPDAELLEHVDVIDRAVESMACGAGSELGTGGMATKIKAAKMVTGSGEEMVIADGRLPKVLGRILAGEPLGTVFYPHGDKLASRKHWIAFGLRCRGSVQLDAGAALALKNRGKSLLPSGIRTVTGRFKQGDCVGLLDESGREFARGLSNYSSDDVVKLCGVKTADIERVLGYKNSDEIIHRDDLVLLA